MRQAGTGINHVYWLAIAYTPVDCLFFVFTGGLGLLYSVAVGILSIVVMVRGRKWPLKIILLSILCVVYAVPLVAMLSFEDAPPMLGTYWDGNKIAPLDTHPSWNGVFVLRGLAFFAASILCWFVIGWEKKKIATQLNAQID